MIIAYANIFQSALCLRQVGKVWRLTMMWGKEQIISNTIIPNTMLHLNWIGEVWLGLLIGSFELSFPMFCHRLDKVNLKCYDTVLKKVDLLPDLIWCCATSLSPQFNWTLISVRISGIASGQTPDTLLLHSKMYFKGFAFHIYLINDTYNENVCSVYLRRQYSLISWIVTKSAIFPCHSSNVIIWEYNPFIWLTNRET